MEIQELNRQVFEKSQKTQAFVREVQKVIVGQEYMIRRILVGLLTNGHILLEGVPGLAKTLAISTSAKAIKASFSRIQFTPDLLPADIIGTMIYSQKTGEFSPKLGPIFANFVLADEINRAPAKVQSALLECMQEKQVTLGDKTYSLEDPFLVLATQNPLDQEGTYPLPEAQMDRFMLKLKIDYPSKEQERQILKRMIVRDKVKVSSVITPQDLLEIKAVVENIYMEEKISEYILDIVFATREPQKYKRLKDLRDLIECGASPRATIAMARGAKAHAFLSGRGFVTPDDIKAISKDILRHRMILSYQAEAEQITVEDIIDRIFDEIHVP